MKSPQSLAYQASRESLIPIYAGEKPKLNSGIWNMAVIVAALGYFVDVYDLILFNGTRIPSLISLGYGGSDLLYKGTFLLNCQMVGMLLGGVLWGVLGDKRGRLSVLFGSIFLYSIANILNGNIHSIDSYAACRFIAGLGLAGELGAGITLVSETMTKERRGFGTTLVSAFGIFGAVAGAVIAKQFEWRTAYYIGGALGLVLLVLRISAYESGLFNQLKNENINRGNFFSLFNNFHRFSKYIKCILLGIPIWFLVGIISAFGPELAQALHIGIDANGKTIVTNADLVMRQATGCALGSLFSGLLSQYFKKRKKALYFFLAACAICLISFLTLKGISVTGFYLFIFIYGLASGYWSVFITISTEQFGTNIRSTATTTIPNFVRGAIVPTTFLFLLLNSAIGNMVTAAFLVGAIVLTLAFIALWKIEETYGKDLSYLEKI